MLDMPPASDPLDAPAARQELFAIRDLLDYAFGTLGGEGMLSDEEQAAFREMVAATEQQVSLPPRAVALPITDRTYLAQGWPGVPVKMADLMRQAAFYYLQVPVTLWPRPGYRIEELEVRIFYNPGQPPDRQPLTHDIFPDRRWLEIINWEEQLELVLDEGAHFKVQTPGLSQALMLLGASIDTIAPGQGARFTDAKVAEALQQMGIDLGARINAAVDAGTRIKLGPFHYLWRRPLLMNAGKGDVKALWRFSDRNELEGDEELHLGVVLQVPRGLETLKIVPEVLARPRPVALNTILATLVARLRQAMESLRQQFGPEVEQQVDRFEQHLRDGWTIRVGGGALVWDLSDTLRQA